MGATIAKFVEFSTSILQALSSTQRLTDQFDTQSKFVKDLVVRLTPLIERYEKLAEKSELSTDEQEELDIIINQLAKDVPGAVTEFDKYGKS